MATKLHLLILFLTILKCNGHVPILSDILSGTHSIFRGVAGGVIDLIGPHEKPEQTVIVLVEKEQNNHHHHHHNKPYGNNNGQYGPGHNEYRPDQNAPGAHNGVNGNYGYQEFNRPRPNGYNRPIENNGNYNGNHGQNTYQNPNNKPNRYPQNNYGNPGYDRPYYNPQQNDQLNNNREDNNYGQTQPNYGTNFNNNQPRPNYFNNNILQANPGNQNNYNENNDFMLTGPEASTLETFVNPSTELSTSKPSSTNKPDDDVPLFIPLNPEDKDDTTNSAPKRETDKKPVDQDEDFDLDIRIKNE